uniref:ATP synthase peripheral stalk subunit OSCP, mitochondrial n=2 Tax=Plectus sambesii TaxID=2011161 RepID=A0A914W7L8_9BILA
AISKKLGLSETSQNFLTVVAENGKLKKLQAMIRSYEGIMSAHRGELFCSVITAKPLDANMTKELNEALQSFAKAGQKLHVTTSVDPALLGGMIVNVGDKYVDMSLASKIKKYTSVLKSSI